MRIVACEACDREIDRDDPDECSSRPEGFFCSECTTHPEHAEYLRVWNPDAARGTE